MYLETTLNAQAYFARALDRNRDANLQERLNQLNADYNEKLEKEHKVESIDFKIKEIRERLTYIITELTDRYDNYTITDFVSKVAQLDYLEKQKEKQEKVEKEKDFVKEMFGDFNTHRETKVKKHGVYSIQRVAKTSDELTKERNERLAILNKMYNDKKIGQEYFVKAVVAVRRRYASEIQKQVAWEVKKEENLKPSKFKNIINKVKTAFHFNNKVEKINTIDKSSNFYSECATQSLIQAYNFLNDEQAKTLQNEAKDCLTDAFETNKASMNMYYSDELKAIVNDMFEKKKEHIEKVTRHTVDANANKVLRTREENLVFELNYLSKERLSYFSIFDKYKQIKSPDNIKEQAQELENYILKNYKHSYGQGVIQNGSIVLGEIKFEDKKIEAVYAEMKLMFKGMEEMQKTAQKADKNLEQKASKVAQNMQEASL